MQRKAPANATFFPISQVHLLDGPFKRRQDVNTRYLLEIIEPDRLIAPFRIYAGLEPKAECYGGWEKRGGDSSGTSLARYLSAISFLQASSADAKTCDKARGRLDYIIAELMACLRAKGSGDITPTTKNTPRVGATPVSYFKTHKLMAGLRDAHRLAGSNDALVLERAIADWIDSLLGKLSPAQAEAASKLKAVGMNEVFADLSVDTGDPRYLRRATEFFHPDSLLESLHNNEAKIENLHANAHITSIVGIAREYELTGDARLRAAATIFWETVVHDHSYAIGGNSESESFFPPSKFPQRLTSRTCETCNSYNMLKLSRHLFEWEPDAAHMDYVERALINHILASSGEKPGEFNYFLSLGAVSIKAFSSPLGAWWCCVGSGMESPSRFPEQIYARDSTPALWINQYIASALDWPEAGLRLLQETQFPDSDIIRIKITTTDKKPRPLSLKLRHPAWCDAPEVKINNQPAKISSKPSSYFTLARDWNDGDTIELRLPMTLRAEPLPHSKDNTIAFLHGPSVLAAIIPDTPASNSTAKQRFRSQLDARGKTDDPPPLIVAKNVAAALARLLPLPDRFAEYRADNLFKPGAPTSTPSRAGDVPQHRASTAPSLPPKRHAFPIGTKTTPTAKVHADAYASLTLVPLHRIYEKQYAVYFPLLAPSKWTKHEAQIRAEWRRLEDLAASTLDIVIPGRDDSHALRHQGGATGRMFGRPYRVAMKNGDWFSYEMAVSPDTPVTLIATYWGGIWATPRAFAITIDGKHLASQHIHNNSPGDFMDVPYPIPPDWTHGKTKITVRFTARPRIAEIFGLRTVPSAGK